MESTQENLKDLLDNYIGDFSSFNSKNYHSIASKIRNKNILSFEDGDNILGCLKDLADFYKNGIHHSIEPILILLLNKISNYAVDSVINQILLIIIELYPLLNNYDQGYALKVIAKFSLCEKIAFNFLIEKIKSSKNPDISSCKIYESIKMLTSYDESNAKHFTSFFAEYIFDFNKFQDIGLIELFSHWHFENKIENHPIERHLDKVKQFIINYIPYDEYSYVVSVIAAFIKINNNEAIEILRIASKHPSLEVQIEAVYCRAAHGDKNVIKNFIKMALDPRISWKIKDYLTDLKKNFNIELVEVIEIIKKEFLKEEFIAQAKFCSYIACEFGRPPDEIKTLGQMKYSQENNLSEHTIFFINYIYYDESEGTGYSIISYNENSELHASSFAPNNNKYSTVQEAFEAFKDDIIY